MGLFKRVKNVMLADLHDLIDKLEDPISMTKQYLRELEEQMEKAQRALAQQFAIERRYEQLIQQAEEMIEKRARQAKLAVEKNEEAIAKMALQEKIAYEKKLALYKQQYETLKEKTTYLTEQLKQLHEKYEELKAKQLDLIARANAAQAIKDINASLISFNPEHALKGFARMEERILALEAEAKASSYLYESYKALHTLPLQNEVEKELEQLKEAK
ncbi:phage shock protein A (PspA) family protein [Thermolongibacillus altinsuensis]|jgi:phage shock protein A|uniref:Phage shock protein A (PspA) family protein n=1 Tax=Thermolongibacillus altinsuensis TaxID=575256 RepID=A0A4R1QBM4_9BACL|nr:PspA/IM30 family protein [Thermolongibacillus altinsuensis]TCL45022.1 phage shock protein A (PspA) family protein [Thermolongibacillus altinsuensis]